MVTAGEQVGWKYVSKDFKMLIAAAFIIAKQFEAIFMFFNRKMVESVFHSS